MKPSWWIGGVAFCTGALVASAGWTAFPPNAKPRVTADDGAKRSEVLDDDGLRRANENLTESLHACDRKLAELREQGVPPPTASAAAEAPDGGGRFGRRRDRGEPTAEDWERMAQLGVVRVRIPCIRDSPWTPSQRVMDRLGLAPQDAEAIKEAYEHSNKRVTDLVRPMCANVLGSPDAIDKIGVSACIDSIARDARKTNAEGAREALKRTAEVNAGKREAAKGDAPALEQLAAALTKESKAFENDLAQKLGPEEAKRLASAPELCSERKMLRAEGDREEVDGDGPGAGRRGGRR